MLAHVPGRKTAITDKLAYPGMALAFLAAAPEAGAQIILTDLDPDVEVSFSTYGVDINNDGTVELEITRTEFGSMHYVGITDQAPGVSVLGLYYSNNMFPDRLENGDPIAPGDPDWRNDAQGWLVSFYSYGQWAFGNPSGFLGVRFQDDGNTYYGWIELKMETNTTLVKAYAYESLPGTAINAGDTGTTTVIPDLGTSGNAISLFPNPATEEVKLTGLTGVGELRVLTAAGQAVEAGLPGLPDATGQITLEVGMLPAGAYMVQLRYADRVETRPFIKR